MTRQEVIELLQKTGEPTDEVVLTSHDCTFHLSSVRLGRLDTYSDAGTVLPESFDPDDYCMDSIDDCPLVIELS